MGTTRNGLQGGGERVPFLDVKAGYEELRDELDAAYQRVMKSGWYILGGEAEAFEAELASYLGARHCIGVGNGLEALQLALRACGVRPGDEVLVPGHTFIATWLAVSQVGAMPVPVEPDETTYNLDAGLLERALTPRTRAVIPVHLYGQPVLLDVVLDFARRHGLRVIEDAAQAHGAHYRGRPVGTRGDAGAFSFYPGKNLGCFGDGGAVVTDDDEVAEQVRLLRNYGSRIKYQHEAAGTNSRLDELQAAFLRVKLTRLDEWNGRRTRVAETYCQALAGLPGLLLPTVAKEAEPVWHLFVVRHEERARLQDHLRQAGVETMIHYPTPPHLSGAYRALGSWPALPRTERLAREVLSLPMGPHLTPHEALRVSEAVRTFCLSARRRAA